MLSSTTNPRSVSPVKKKIEIVYDRLANLSAGLNESRYSKIQFIDKKLSDLQKKLGNIQKKRENDIFDLQKETEQINLSLNNLQKDREAVDEMLENRSEDVEKDLRQAVEKKKEDNRQNIEDMKNTAFEQLNQFAIDGTRLFESRQGLTQTDLDAILNQIPDLKKKIDEEKDAELQFMKELKNQMDKEMKGLHENIENERRKTRHMEEEAVEALRTFNDAAAAQLQDEYVDRTTTEDSLQKLWRAELEKMEDVF